MSEWACSNQAACNTPTIQNLANKLPADWSTVVRNGKQVVLCSICDAAAIAAVPVLGQ